VDRRHRIFDVRLRIQGCRLHSFAEAAGLVAAFLFSLLVVALLLAALFDVVLFPFSALFVVALLLAALLLVALFFASCLGLWCIKVVPAVRHLVIPLYFAIRIHTSRAISTTNGYPTSGEPR
jgi:hypothetical protein